MPHHFYFHGKIDRTAFRWPRAMLSPAAADGKSAIRHPDLIPVLKAAGIIALVFGSSASRLSPVRDGGRAEVCWRQQFL